MKVFKVYFLALLLIFMVPVLAEDAAEEKGSEEAVSEEAAPGTEEAKEEEAEKKEEEKPAEKVKADAEKPAENKVADEAPVQPKAVEENLAVDAPEKKVENTETKLDEPKVTAKVENEGEGVADKKDDKEKSAKKFNVSVSNGFSYGLSKERKSFSYNLNLGMTYALPWQLMMNAGVGLNALYRYDMEKAVATESGDISSEKVDYGKFDGTPLNIGLSRPFPLFWEIGGSLGINVGLPFTSTELWEQYNIYTMLSVGLDLMRSFKIAKETSISAGFSFGYTKTFAKYDYAMEDYQNDILSPINEHGIDLGLELALAYKGASLKVGGGYNIAKNYSVTSMSYDDDSESETVYQPWSYAFSFKAVAAYTLKSWNFAIGAMTNAPEYDSGNYSGFSAVDGDPAVKNGSANYPFKAKYTRVFANISYLYSF